MQLQCIEGKNNKKYIKVFDLFGKDDIKALNALETILSRTEYKPFSRGFNKNIYDSYFIDKTYIPSTFIQEITKKFLPLYPEIKIENQKILFNNDISKENFSVWLETLNLPNNYDLISDKYNYQPESVYRALLFKTARIEIGTGGGKTLITYLYCKYIIENLLPKDKKILIIVPRKGLCKQTADEFFECDANHENKIKISTIYSGGTQVQNAQVVIGTYHSLKEYDIEYFSDFYAVICDEVHGSKTYSIKTEIYNKIMNAEYLFGMTGTYPEEKTLDYIHIVSMWGPLVYSKKTYQLIEDGNVVPVKINAIKIYYNDSEINDFSKNLKNNGIVGTEKFLLEKSFFQNYMPRTQLMIKLISAIPANHLILVDTVEYCKYLKNLFDEVFAESNEQVTNAIIYGNISDKERNKIKSEMRETFHRFNLFATYETMSTGESIKTISNVHFPDGGKSPIRVKQSYGRGVRLHPEKNLLNVWDYQDQMPYSSFKQHASYRNKIYESEKIPIIFTGINI